PDNNGSPTPGGAAAVLRIGGSGRSAAAADGRAEDEGRDAPAARLEGPRPVRGGHPRLLACGCLVTALRRVGILGGMGPEATVLLMSRVIAATPAKDDADHIPLIVDQNPQGPSRIARLIEGIGADPAPVLAAMARRLEVA